MSDCGSPYCGGLKDVEELRTKLKPYPPVKGMCPPKSKIHLPRARPRATSAWRHRRTSPAAGAANAAGIDPFPIVLPPGGVSETPARDRGVDLWHCHRAQPMTIDQIVTSLGKPVPRPTIEVTSMSLRYCARFPAWFKKTVLPGPKGSSYTAFALNNMAHIPNSVGPLTWLASHISAPASRRRRCRSDPSSISCDHM